MVDEKEDGEGEDGKDVVGGATGEGGHPFFDARPHLDLVQPGARSAHLRINCLHLFLAWGGFGENWMLWMYWDKIFGS